MGRTYIFQNEKYILLENNKNGFDEEILKEKLTDYFVPYDYVVGDWAYNKLRLKGFNDKNNKNFNKYNDYNGVKKYIEQNCA